MPRPPPSIIAGPPIPMFERIAAMTTSQHPSNEALPAKHLPEVTPTSGTSPLSFGKSWNDRVLCDATVGVARPPAAAFGKQYQRQSQLPRDLEHPVFFAMVLVALRPGQHRVVVGYDDAARLGRAEQIAIDRRRAR